MEDNIWLMELEAALLDGCTVNEIFAICRGKSIPASLRPDVWEVCLNVRQKPNQLIQFDEIFDLPNQAQLREDCNQFVDKLGNDDEEKLSVISDIESILTFYCKNRNLKYETSNLWIELLLPLLSLKLKRSQTYNLFESIRDTYIPKGCIKNGNVFHLFRLLIEYHDPELCSMLDTKRITPDIYSMGWFLSLFASTCTFPVVLAMWDLYFQQADPFLVFFLSLIILINGREQIIAMKNESKETIVEFLKNMPSELEVGDVVDFCALAHYYAMKTPFSFKTELLKALFGAQANDNSNTIISQALCLPVLVYELVENVSLQNCHPDTVKFFLVDCRPAEQYNAGHLSTAFHLDCNLMLQEPTAFSTAVQGLLRAQRQAIDSNSIAGGEHLCFMGSGRLEEDQYTHMVVASFLQKNTKYVSLLTGGYEAIHEYYGESMVDFLEDHDTLKCIVCSNNTNGNIVSRKVVPPDNNMNNDNGFKKPQQPNSNSQITASQKQSTDIFSKLSTAMKIKTSEVKDKLLDYIVNPNANQVGTSQVGNLTLEKHVSPAEKNGKKYRNVASVFSIDDDEDNMIQTETENTEENINEIVSTQEYLKSPDIIKSFKCQEVYKNGSMFDSILLVTNTHLIVLRESNKSDESRIVLRRQLSSIIKITRNKRHRDLITFKYGTPDSHIVTDMDKFLIQNASQATALVSEYIVKQLENK